MNAVSVQFFNEYKRKYSGKEYSYKCRLNNIEIGDLVVVDARGELKVVLVSSLDADLSNEEINYKELLCKLPELIKN